MLKGLFLFSTTFSAFRASVTYPTLKLSNVNTGAGTFFNGASTNDASGTSVASVGDVNADGLNDFIIGAPWADPNGPNSGAAFVVFGRPNYLPTFDLSVLDGTNGFRINGVSTGDNTGISVAGPGDVNGDGIDDVIIGAHAASPYNRTNAGVSYVVFGKNTGFASVLELSTLNGANGFKINGAVANERSGNAVAGAGDINGDGIKDILIGAPQANPGLRSLAGSSYVIHGSSSPFSANIDLSTFLNGANGFRINGVSAGDWSGIAVSSAGDINKDGIDDLIIGAFRAAPGGRTMAGSCFVVFGKNSSIPNPLELSSLDGTNGFRMNGVAQNDQLGVSVSSAGDINRDGIQDIIMGASGASPPGRIAAGTSFVYYGHPMPFNGTIELSTLNASNGFKIYGRSTSDASGSSVGYAQDFNGDGFNDLLIGAPFAQPDGIPNGGETYVVFGPIQNTSTVDLALLNTQQSFKVSGGVSGIDSIGCSIEAADVNGDGLSDLITGAKGGSPLNLPGAGFTFVTWGDTIQVVQNRLTTVSGQSQVITDYNLNVTVPNNPQYVQYGITGLDHGSFTDTNQPNQTVSGFSRQDVIAGQVNFTHDDSELPPQYNVEVKHTIAITTPFAANISFINQLPTLVNNTLIVNQGQTVQIGPDTLAAIDPDNAQHNAEITFTILSASNGFFSIYSFPQTLIWAGGVYFTQDNTIHAPQYKVSINRGGVTIPAQSAIIDFATNPVLVNNHFDICQGQSKLMSTSMLSANQPGSNASDALVFDISNIQYSHFETTDLPGVEISEFSQAAVKNNSILFVHEGLPNPPNFMFTIHNDRMTTALYSPEISFRPEPTLTIKPLTVNEGEMVILTSDTLQATDSSMPSDNLTLKVSDVTGGKFVRINTTEAIDQFYQSELNEEQIAFQADNSSVAPSYSVSVNNTCSQTKAIPALIDYNSMPVLTNNQLTVTKGKPVILTPTELSATDRESSLVDLGFKISNIKNGHFETLTLPGISITAFSQQMVLNGAIRFVPGNSDSVPSYEVSVSDGVLSTDPQAALVRLTPDATVVSTPVENNTVRDAVISLTITGLGGLALFLLRLWIERRTRGALNNMLINWASPTETKRQAWRQNTAEPIIKYFFKQFKTTGCCGVRNEEKTIAYITGIELILTTLEKNRKVDLTDYSAPECLAFENLIMQKIKEHVLIGKTQSACSACSPALSPEELNRFAVDIANDIHTTLEDESSTTSPARKISLLPKRKNNQQAGIQLVSLAEQKAPSDASHPNLDQAHQIEQLKKELTENLLIVNERLEKVEGYVLPIIASASVGSAEKPTVKSRSSVRL